MSSVLAKSPLRLWGSLTASASRLLKPNSLHGPAVAAVHGCSVPHGSRSFSASRGPAAGQTRQQSTLATPFDVTHPVNASSSHDINAGAHARDLLHLIRRDERLVICSEEDSERLTDICVASFSGDEHAMGEGKFRWVYGPENRSSVEGLHDPRFTAGLRWYMSLVVRVALRWGSVIGCRDPKTGELMGATLAFHPDSLVKGEAITIPRILSTVLRMGSLPPESYRFDKYGFYPTKRADISKETLAQLHKTAAPSKHWYICVLACDPKHTGKGVGSAILKAVIEMSRLEKGVTTYLEAHSDKKTYYDKYMTCTATVRMENPDPKGEGDATMHGFVSDPRT